MGYTVTEEELDSTHFEALLDAKLGPITKTIERLERQQERIVELIANQATMMSNMNHLEDTVKGKVVEADKIHNELFNRLRQVEVDCRDRVNQVEKDSSYQVWDILKLIISSILGGIVALLAWLVGKS